MSGKPGAGGRPGRSGRKPGPASLAKIELEIAEGTSVRISPPAYLSKGARLEYRRAVKLLAARKHWREEFRIPVAVYAQACDDWIEARGELAHRGKLYMTPKEEPALNPWVGIAERAEARLMRVAMQMGLTLVGLSRTLRQHSRERVLVKDGQVGIERETWDADLLA